MGEKRKGAVDERIFNYVGSSVRRREGDGNYEIGGNETQQDKHEEFALPT